MGMQVVTGAQLMCNKGTTPCPLTATTAVMKADANFKTVATVMDHKPVVNIPSFGMCTTTTNPQVSSATSAAQGVLTPMPCVPIINAPWSQGSKDIKIANQTALNDKSKCKCQWAGEISISSAGQTAFNIP